MLSCCGVTGRDHLGGEDISDDRLRSAARGLCAFADIGRPRHSANRCGGADYGRLNASTGNSQSRIRAGLRGLLPASRQLRGKLGARIPLSFGRVPAMPAAELRNTGQQRQRRRQWRGHGAADVQSADRVSGRGPDLPAGRGALRIWTYFRGRRRWTSQARTSALPRVRRRPCR